MAGYSGTPLPRKLGIKPGHRVLLASAPDSFELDLPDHDVEVHRRAGRSAYDVVLVFCPDQAALLKRFVPLAGHITTAEKWSGLRFVRRVKDR